MNLKQPQEYLLKDSASGILIDLKQKTTKNVVESPKPFRHQLLRKLSSGALAGQRELYGARVETTGTELGQI